MDQFPAEQIPCGINREDLKILSAPFDEKTVGVKVQSLSRDKTKAMLVVYLQHTDVYTRLEVVDPDWQAVITESNWWPEHKIFTVRMRITVKGTSRENVGEGEDMKSATSDALKRAAMLFGCGRYLYDSETVWVPYDENRDKYRSFTFADYKSALRKDQAPLPTSTPPPPLVRPAGSPLPRPAAPTSPGPVSTVPQDPSIDPGDVVMPIGSKKGERISNLTKEECESASAWMESKTKESEKPMPKNWLAFMTAVDRYFYNDNPSEEDLPY